MAESTRVILRVRCAHCQGQVELECEGLQGFWGYNTFNEYSCPHCRKQNNQLSSGPVVSARVLPEGDVKTIVSIVSGSYP